MRRIFRLSAKALHDVADILSRLHTGPQPALADSVEIQLFHAFSDLAEIPALGHTRRDITEKDLLFYSTRPYMIVLRQRSAEAYILRVVHGARDLSKLF